MTINKFARAAFYNSIGSHEPALVVGDGDTVVTETLDAHGFDREGRKRGEGAENPMTGPFYVSGAAPGDALRLRIERITNDPAHRLDLPGAQSDVVNPGAASRFPARQVTDLGDRCDRPKCSSRKSAGQPSRTGP
jgi:hypothetical protein